MEPLSPAMPLETWQKARDRAVFGLFGIAQLRSTTWLSHEPQDIQGIPGAWKASEGRAIRLDDSHSIPASLAPGESFEYQDSRIVAIERDGSLALRLFEPTPPTATGIERYSHDPAWRLEGTYTRFAEALELESVSVDGHHSHARFDGHVIASDPWGTELKILMRVDAGSLFAPFSDAGSADGTYRFRMIRADVDTALAPGQSVAVTLDFNKAYLPPSAFSAAYLCVLPPPQNSVPMRVDAGEKAATRAAS